MKDKFKQTEINGISMAWHESRVGDHIELAYGDGLPERVRKNGHIPVFGSNGIIGFHDKSLVKGPGIIIGRKGTVGQVVFSKTDFWPIDTTYYVKIKGDDDMVFWYYFLSTLGLNQMNSHSAVPGLNRDNVYEISTSLPSLSEQRAIAKILSDLDEKIELNHQMNKTLESIAQAIFKRWFVDFEFPGHGKTKFVNNLPEGWYEGCLADILEISIGGDWGNDNEAEGMVQAISLRGTDLESLKSGGYASEAPVRWIRKDKLGKRIIRDSDILIGGSGLGPIGKTIYCSRYLNGLYAFPVTYSNFCKRLTAKTPGFAVYAERILENMYLSGEMNQFYTGTSIPNLDVNSLIKFPVIIPTAGIVSKFYEIVAHKFMKLFNKENVLLSQIRDSLLPRLMSGKIRVN
jgi:type I restriction enzyme S subunit